MLNNLGTSLLARFEQLSDLDDLNEGISAQEEALQLIPDGHRSKPILLTNLGNCLQSRFEQFGDLNDLNECILKQKDAVHLTPDGHPDRPTMLHNLCNSLSAHFKQVGDLNDLNEAISKMEDMVCLTQDGHPDKPSRLNNLGNFLLIRFEQFGDPSDLAEGISKHEDAIHLTPDGHPDKPGRLRNLGSSLRNRFELLGNLVDLNESISMLEDAIHMTPDYGDSGKPSRLNNLGISLHTRFVQLGDFEDLKEGISALKDAVCLTPEGHPDKPKILNNFGNILVVHSNQFHDLNDLQEIICQYTSAACSTTGPAYVRFKAASQWAFSALMEQDPSVLKAYDRALDLLQEVAWLGLSVNDRHHQIIKAGPVVRGAAEAAIFSGQPEKAVELLEQGRSVIWGQLLNLRTPIDALKQKYPDIAQKLIVISAQLEGASTRGSDHDLIDSATLQSLQSIAHQAHNNAYNRDMLLKKIRELEGFQQFLLPKSISELSAALKGPVVFLNVGLALCDALVLMPGLHAEVKHVPLTEFTPEHVKSLSESLERLMPYMGRRNTDRLHGQREGGFASLEDEFAHILSELWVSLAKPVLAVLAITTPTKDCLPRIWWCPTGPLTFLPIHAAGLYGKDDPFGSKLSDFVISSYTPSLAALTQCFRPASESHPELQLLTVAQPSAVGQSYIPGTKDEVNRIQESARGKILVSSLVEHEATIERVEDSMMKSAWVHFACHGVQDKSAPTHSALLLAGSSQLTLERIIKLSLPHADLAFLSACQTATGDKKLQEESVHLAAGMLLAGYRSVIATMWSVMDNDAPQVASDVYEYLFKTSPPDSTQAAEALHLAVGNLREGSGGKKSFFHWVPFIHVGA
ncbi:CHAT domain-containing protein [Mycena leptocephala]|nr:CHAT domain-containing protein [Mycena leptocephala]